MQFNIHACQICLFIEENSEYEKELIVPHIFMKMQDQSQQKEVKNIIKIVNTSKEIGENFQRNNLYFLKILLEINEKLISPNLDSLISLNFGAHINAQINIDFDYTNLKNIVFIKFNFSNKEDLKKKYYYKKTQKSNN